MQRRGKSMGNSKTIRMVNPEKVAGTDGTWAQCTRKGNFLFISGQVGLDIKGNIVGRNNFEKQAKQALDNLVLMIEAGGGKLEDLMMITVFVTDMNNRPIFAKVRNSYFRKNPPASTIVEIKRLFMDGILIEINGIAIL
jgi:enamine deaminase RidA (YjgF/YER057c/UK114 family)